MSERDDSGEFESTQDSMLRDIFAVLDDWFPGLSLAVRSIPWAFKRRKDDGRRDLSVAGSKGSDLAYACQRKDGQKIQGPRFVRTGTRPIRRNVM